MQFLSSWPVYGFFSMSFRPNAPVNWFEPHVFITRWRILYSEKAQDHILTVFVEVSIIQRCLDKHCTLQAKSLFADYLDSLSKINMFSQSKERMGCIYSKKKRYPHNSIEAIPLSLLFIKRYKIMKQ